MGRRLFVLILCLFGVVCLAEDYPPGWENYILMDQLSNVAVRKGESLKPADSQIVPVFHIDVPMDKAQVVESQYLDEVTRKRVIIEKDGQKFVRVFFVEAQGVPSEDIKKLGFPVESHYWGTKMQSHMTFLLWEKENPSASPFFVKMSLLDEAGRLNNGFGNAMQAVKNSDFAETILRKSGNSFASVFPERFGSGLANLGLYYANSIREARPIHVPEGAELLPVHGLLGSKSDLESLAKARGLRSAQEWIEQEYLPKFGQFLAEMHFRQGIYIEAHSQNVLAQIDRKTGKIVGMVGRDLNDVLIDPFVHAVQGNPLKFTGARKAPGSLMNFRFVDAVLGKYAGYHMGTYPAQSVTDITLDHEEKGRYSALFLESYLKAARKVTGKVLDLSPTAEQAVFDLKAGVTPPPHQFSRDVGEPEGTIILVAQEVYEKVMEARTEKLLEGVNAPDHVRLQWQLESQFWSHLRENKVAFLQTYSIGFLTNPATKVVFKATKAGILAVDLNSGQPLGLAYDISPAEQARIEEARIPHAKWLEGLVKQARELYNRCGWAWMKLLKSLQS